MKTLIYHHYYLLSGTMLSAPVAARGALFNSTLPSEMMNSAAYPSPVFALLYAALPIGQK